MDAQIPGREGKAVTGLTPAALAAWVEALGPQAGTLQVISPHHCWRLLLVGEGLLLAESGDRPLDPFLRKAKDVRPPLPNLPELERLVATDGVERLTLYRAIGSEETLPENTRQALQQTLYEVLLAIVLESELTVRWYPDRAIAALALPRWRFATLYKGLLPEVQRWRGLTYVRHPYQRVQLLDSDDTIAHVPLFAGVTGGRHPIVEIADRFRQDVFRTALKLDKLAEKRTVAILPLSPLTVSPEPIATAARAPTICVVDDSPVLLQQFAALLQEWGYDPLMVSQPQTAIAQMLAARPALAFLDINMPESSGFDLIAQIRRQPEIAKMPIVLVTSESNIANSLRAKWANSRFLAKPRSAGDIYTFRDALRRHLRELAPLLSDPLV
ncbi:MAG TPA: response regulator [Cyanobacteria bacterium UBA8156]|jgi:CheY-like chemotaxis protein|nr:response regulator [Cyanobacteria bacterium UBA8156]